MCVCGGGGETGVIGRWGGKVGGEKKREGRRREVGVGYGDRSSK